MNVAMGGGPVPAACVHRGDLPDVLDGTIEPGRVFDQLTDLEGVPDGYRAMNDLETIKVLIEFP